MKRARHTKKSSDRGSKRRKHSTTQGWEEVSRWYDGMVGDDGSRHHRYVIPILMKFLKPKRNERILDIGCGQGVLSSYITEEGANYIGVDISKSLIKRAKVRHQSKTGKITFLQGDAHSLRSISQLSPTSFDAAVFLLSIQDIRYLSRAITSASWALKSDGRVVILMTHPSFRIPRQSGWGFDNSRKLIYRRIDSYLSRLDVPLRYHHKSRKVLTRSYHRPLQEYVEALSRNDLLLDKMQEIPVEQKNHPDLNKSEQRALSEFPLFLLLRARKVTHSNTQ